MQRNRRVRPIYWENGRQQKLSISDQMPDYEHYKHMEPKETMFKENPKELSKKTIRTNKLVQ